LESVAENFDTTTSTDAKCLTGWPAATVGGPRSALLHDRTRCDGGGELRELNECRDFDDRVMSPDSNPPCGFRAHLNLPIATFFGRDSPLGNAVESASANRFTANPTNASRLLRQLAAMVCSPRLALHPTGCDGCGDLREWNDCRDFDDTVMSPGSNPPRRFSRPFESAVCDLLWAGQSLGKCGGKCFCKWVYGETNQRERLARAACCNCWQPVVCVAPDRL
jgi:hypothetical protein